MARRVKPPLLTAIIAVLLLHFETGLQHYFLSSYYLETPFNCIHKIARIIKRKHIQSASSPNILNVTRFLNLNPLSSSVLNLKVKTASNGRYINKHLEKMFRSAAKSTTVKTLGSFSIDDGNRSEDVSFKMNSRFFKVCRVYSILLKMASAGEFPWS